MLNSIKSFEGGYDRTDLKSPVYMDTTKGTKEQVNQINTIIQSAYNEFIEKTTQTRINEVRQWQVTKRANTNVGEYHDNCFEEYCHLSFYFNSTGYTSGDQPIVFVIKRGTPLSGITFLGVNSLESPSDFLNNYGYFTFTYNQSLNEYHISFVPFADCPSTSWAVYMTFSYEATEA